MIRPTDLATADYPVALKPGLGHESQLYVSTEQHTVLGEQDIVTLNSGTYTPQVADNLLLQANPQEVLAVLMGDVDFGSQNVVVTVAGTDQNDAALTGTATFKTPAYAQDTSRVYPKGYAVEVIPAVDGKKFKTIINVTVSCSTAAARAVIKLIGVPSLSTFHKIGVKTQLNYDPNVPMPVPIQEGRDKGAYIKPGEIDVGNVALTTKILSPADGLSRINGRRVTGLIKEIKEDKVTTQHVFALGLIITLKITTGESIEPNTYNGTGLCELFPMIVAQ